MRLGLIVLLGAAALTAPAAAQSVELSARVKGDLGYGTNPFLRAGESRGTGLFTGLFAPRLAYETPRSTTALAGSYSRDQYFSNFGYTDSLGIHLTRNDRLSEYLTSNLTAGYTTSNRTTIVDEEAFVGEPFDLGRRTRSVNADEQLSWQASATDHFVAGADFRHQSYGQRSSIPGAIASNYTTYSGNVGYDRVINARTSIGAEAILSVSHSARYPDSRTIQPAVTVKRQFSPAWSLDGHLGVVIQHVSGPFPQPGASLGYGLNLCGDYPHTHVCFSADHGTSATGYGSLRTQTSVSATLSRDLTEHSHVSFSARYYKSGGDRVLGPLVARSTKAATATGDYDRDLTQRISAGFGGRFEWRDTQTPGSAHAVRGTVHISAKLGRI